MTDKDLKFLEAEFEKTFNYDPDEEEVDAKYDDEYNEWEKEFINKK